MGALQALVVNIDKIKGTNIFQRINDIYFIWDVVKGSNKIITVLLRNKIPQPKYFFLILSLAYISWVARTNSWSIDVRLTIAQTAGYIGFGNGCWWSFFIWKSANINYDAATWLQQSTPSTWYRLWISGLLWRTSLGLSQKVISIFLMTKSWN